MEQQLSKYIILRSEHQTPPSGGNTRGGGNRGGPIVATPQDMSPLSDQIKLEEASLTSAERNDLQRDPSIEAIAPQMPMKLIEPVEVDHDEENDVNDPEVDSTWGIKAVKADQSNFDGSGITVAVLDTGIDPNHDAFSSVKITRKNFTTEADDDLDGHGTHCAGTIFGQDLLGEGVRIGVARNIEHALIAKVLGEGSSSGSIAQAIQWAVDEGAHVISMSLGMDFPKYVKQLVDQDMNIKPATSLALEGYRANINLYSSLSRYIDNQNKMRANTGDSKGTIIIAASGNESRRPRYEIAVAPPAAGTGIIAVGALGNNKNGFKVARFSNTGVDISAPGVKILSAYPNNKTKFLRGTSMAAPHVAGVAALWAQKQLKRRGEVDSQTLMANIISSGNLDTLAPNSKADDVGEGIVQAPL